jgi:hypothetical protein
MVSSLEELTTFRNENDTFEPVDTSRETRNERVAGRSYLSDRGTDVDVSVFATSRVEGPGRVLAGYVLLSAAAVLFPYAAPLAAAALWYRGVAWATSADVRRAFVGKTLVVLAAAMTAYSALVVTGLPVGSGFAEVTGQ